MKLTFDEALQRLHDGRMVRRDDVYLKAQRRKLWVAEWHIPGCLSESQAYCLTKADAVQAGIDFASNDVDHFPRGLRQGLERDGSFQHHTELYGNVITTVYQVELSELLS